MDKLLRNVEAHGVRMPDGFAIMSEAFRLQLTNAKLDDFVYSSLEELDIADIVGLSRVAQQIVARELGIPCVVGAGDAASRRRNGREVTVADGKIDSVSVTADALPALLEARRLDAQRAVPKN